MEPVVMSTRGSELESIVKTSGQLIEYGRFFFGYFVSEPEKATCGFRYFAGTADQLVPQRGFRAAEDREWL